MAADLDRSVDSVCDRFALAHNRWPFLIFPLRDAAANFARARFWAAVGAFDLVDLTVCRCARILLAARTGRRFGLRRRFGVARLTFFVGDGDACAGSSAWRTWASLGVRRRTTFRRVPVRETKV